MSLSALEKYMPPGTLASVEELIRGKSLLIKVKNERKSKFGDYRPLRKGWKHQISINNNLNKYAFLITLLHEIAHMMAFEKYSNRINPHGAEWQNLYSILLKDYLNKGVFPANVEEVLHHHVMDPSASSCTDLKLYKALKAHDESNHTKTHVEDIREGERFIWRKEKIFIKEAKLRTRYKCKEISTGKTYFFHPLAEVEKTAN
jgi:SprT protein